MGERQIGIIMMMRLSSVRVPRKLLADVGDQALFGYAATTALEAARQTGAVAIACIPRGDEELAVEAEARGLSILWRTTASGQGETRETIYDAPLREALMDICDYVIAINPCMPFLNISTLVALAEKAKTAEGSIRPRRTARGFVWNEAGEMIIGTQGTQPNTKTNPLYYQIAHNFWGCFTGAIGTPEMFNWREFVEAPCGIEALDVDTPEDLELVRAWAAYSSRPVISDAYPYPHLKRQVYPLGSDLTAHGGAKK